MMRTWGWPLAIGLATAAGLLTGLVADGAGDVLAWIGLGVPVAVSTWFGWRGPRRQRTGAAVVRNGR